MSTSTKKLANPFGGPAKWVTEGLADALKTYCAIKDIPWSALYVIQGSNNVGVVASAGTHDKDNCIDTVITVDDALCKKIGIVSWERVPPAFSRHSHMVLLFGSNLAWLAAAQEKGYRANRTNGLGNLTHRDTSWCPRYRSVRHLKGPYPASTKLIAEKATLGYSEAGCDPVNDKDLVKQKRAKGYILSNLAGKVECQGKDYFVTTGGTFYLADDFHTYVPEIKVTKDTNIYKVAVDVAAGFDVPGKARKTVINAKRGAKITAAGIAKVDGATYVKNVAGHWWLRRDLDVAKPAVPKPPTPKPAPITDLRVGQFNLPDKSKIKSPSEDVRVAEAVRQIESVHLDVVFFNEMVGPGKDSDSNKPSAFAAKVAAKLGGGWGLIVGRTAFNENYAAYRKATMSVRSQHDDIILRVAGAEGKHALPITLVHDATKREVLTAGTHLVANNEPAAGKQAELLGPKLKALAAGDLTVVCGDMNTNAMLSGFDNAGLKSARKSGKKTDNLPTYTTQGKTKPSTDPEWIIDQIWVSDAFVVNSYNVVRNLNADGTFKSPRPSDHFLTWVSLSAA